MLTQQKEISQCSITNAQATSDTVLTEMVSGSACHVVVSLQEALPVS